MQRLLYRVPWDAEAARDRLEQFVLETFGDEEGIGVVDETSFPKAGDKSVRVAKQYCGTLGKIENWKTGDRALVCGPGQSCLSGSASLSARGRVDLGSRSPRLCDGARGGVV